MKTICTATQIWRLGILLTVLCAATSFGQGLVSFRNLVTNSTPVIDAPIYDNCRLSGPRASGTNYRAALLGGPTSAIPAGWKQASTLQILASPYSQTTWVNFGTGVQAGYVAVGTNHLRDSGLPYGSTGMFQVVAWAGTQNTWEEAYNAARSGQIKIGMSVPLILPVTKGPTDMAVSVLAGLNPFAISHIDPYGPTIYSQPLSQTAAIGSSVTFTPVISPGAPWSPASFQWRFNGANLPGETKSKLVISNIAVTHQGPYQLFASNYCDMVTSEVATLTVKHAHLTAQSGNPGAFRLLLTGTPGVTFQLQGTTNFSNWTALGIFTNQVGSLLISDSIAPGSLLRFYRAVLQ